MKFKDKGGRMKDEINKVRLNSGVLFLATMLGCSMANAAKTTDAKTVTAKPATAKTVAPKNVAIKKTAAKSMIVKVPSKITIAPVTSTQKLSQVVTLSNGVTLVTRLDRIAPRVAISLVVRAGAADESTLSAGWRRVLTDAMLRASVNALSTADKTSGDKATGDKATGDKANAAEAPGPETPNPKPQTPTVLSGAQIQQLADAAGGQIGASVGDDAIEFFVNGKSENAALLLDLLLNVVQHPRLSDADIKRAKKRIGENTQDDAVDVALAATAALRTQVYRSAAGKPSAYGLPQSTPESLQTLSSDKIRAWYHKFFTPAQIVIGAAGDLNVATLRARLEKIAADTAFADAAATVPAPGAAPTFFPVAKTDPPLVVKQLPTADAWVFVSYLGVKSNAPDAPALRVLAAALGESPVARLPRRLLGKTMPIGDESAFQTSVSFAPRRWGSEFVIYAQAPASKVDGVKNAMLDEMRKVREKPLTAAELSRAKNFVAGSFAVDRESLRERAFDAALAAATGMAPDWEWPARVQRVSAEDVRRAALKYGQNYAVALIMPQN